MLARKSGATVDALPTYSELSLGCAAAVVTEIQRRHVHKPIASTAFQVSVTQCAAAPHTDMSNQESGHWQDVLLH